MLNHLLLGFCLCLLLNSGLAHARRVALVIGNAAYQNEKPLANPVNDAQLIASVLRNDLKFDRVIEDRNVSRNRFGELLDEFASISKDADVALIYYSGHGMQGADGNYLIPVDAQISAIPHIARQGVAAGEVVGILNDSKARVALLILDACRNNPFSTGTKDVGKGLGRIGNVGGNLLVAYATREGAVAKDGSGKNSPYTAALASQLRRTDLTVLEMFDEVAEEVSHQDKSQLPTRYGDLKARSYLIPPGGSAASKLANLDVRPGPKPPVADLNLDDLENQSRSRAEQEAKQKGEWATWQSKMLAAYQRLDKLSGADLQVKGWESFLSSYSADNPYSAEDEQLRQQAQQKLSAARTELERQSRPQPPAVNPATTQPQTGQSFRDCADAGCPEMVWLPKGSFMMGTGGFFSWLEAAREKPAHQVSINYDLAVGKFPVTFEQWDACLAAGGCSRRPNDQGWGRGNRPVINVSWEDAQEYLTWLKKKTGKGYRLLSESEWEYAARAGTTTPYYWGDDFGKNHANCDGCGGQWSGKTSPVGSFSANPWGLYDMSGNVLNWVQDCWNDNYSGAPGDGSAWTSGDCSRRVLRGGSWDSGPAWVRSANRDWDGTASRSGDAGFRVARTN